MKTVLTLTLLVLAATPLLLGAELNPAPEPGTIVLLGVGLAGLGLLGWRRSRK